MKSNLAICLLLLPLTTALNAKDSHPDLNQHGANEHHTTPSPAAALAGQIQEISSASSMSRKSQAKLITNALRQAITAATSGINDPARRLAVALELTTAAAEAAPEFAATITSAVAGIPSIAKIDGALDGIQEAVKRGQEHGDDETDTAHPDRDRHHHGHRDFDGPNKCEHIVSGSAPFNSSQTSGSLTIQSGAK